MRKLFQNFRKSESGATLVEYGVALILAIVLGGGALSILAGDTGEQMNRGCIAFNSGAAVTDNPDVVCGS